MRLGYGRSDKRRRRSERTRHSSSEGRSQAEGRGAYLYRGDIVLVQGQMWEPEPEPHSPDLDTWGTHRAEGMPMHVQACTQPHMDTVRMLAQTVIVDYECVCVCLDVWLQLTKLALSHPAPSDFMWISQALPVSLGLLRASAVRNVTDADRGSHTHKALSWEQNLIWIRYVPRIRYGSMSAQFCFPLEL